MNKDLGKKVNEAIKTKCVLKQIDMMIAALKCPITVAGRLIGGSDLEKEFEEFKTKIESIIKNDVQKCSEINDLEQLALWVYLKSVRL